jgi:hypothetical protein
MKKPYFWSNDETWFWRAEDVGYYIRAILRSNCIINEWVSYFMAFGHSIGIAIRFKLDGHWFYEIHE